MTEQLTDRPCGHTRARLVPAARVAPLPRALRPFRHSAYRRLALALAFSTFASGVWVVAMVWEVIRIGGGPAQLSVVSTAGAIGVLLPALLGGVVADRVPQKRILLCVAALELAGMSPGGDRSRSSTSPRSGTSPRCPWPPAWAWRSTTRPTRRGCPRSWTSPTCRPSTASRAWSARRWARRIGPGVAGAVVGAVSSGAAVAVAAVMALAGLVALSFVPLTPVRRDPDADRRDAASRRRRRCSDVREGFVYMVRTPWLLATLLFAALMILAMMGPFEVLIPFLIKDRLGGGPGDHAMVMAAFGIGGALGSLAMASMPMPRRYLTVMNLMWGVGCLPLIVMGLATEIWMIVVAALRPRRDVLRADGDLGDAAAATGAAAHARPGRLARLLHLDQPDAGLDGARRARSRSCSGCARRSTSPGSSRASSPSSPSSGRSCPRTRSPTRCRRLSR